jgi:NAD(P)-dependent dehydrogenase (short-subunit alcohol dehydrogenase family)
MASLGVNLVLADRDAAKQEPLTTVDDAEAIWYPIDIRDEEAVKQCVAHAVARFGRLDILVNCAGITGITARNSEFVDTENLRMVFDINFMGSFFFSKYALPQMREKGYGRILHFASIAGKEGNAGMLAYSASKAAVIGMTKVQGKEYAGTGITVNAIAPAVIMTNLLNEMPAEQLKYMTDKIPMKRCGTMKELVDTVLFIVSPDNSFTTGFTFDLSGGRATY